jgi:hypothetical protein
MDPQEGAGDGSGAAVMATGVSASKLLGKGVSPSFDDSAGVRGSGVLTTSTLRVSKDPRRRGEEGSSAEGVVDGLSTPVILGTGVNAAGADLE